MFVALPNIASPLKFMGNLTNLTLKYTMSGDKVINNVDTTSLLTAKLEANTRIAGRRIMPDIAEAMYLELQKQFIERGHNRTGDSLQSMHVDVNQGKMVADVQMSGGAYFVETGTAPHIIEGNPLHWTEDDISGDAFATQVMNPGIQRDPFLEAAVDAVDVEAAMKTAAETIFSGIGTSVQGSLFDNSPPLNAANDFNVMDTTAENA